MKAVDLKEKGILKNKTYSDIANDITQIVMREYVHYTNDKVFKIDSYGKFFPEMCKNTLNYIEQQYEYQEIFQTLKSKGKRLFLATNSHAEYTNMIMKATVGENWEQYFDITCYHCRKPYFF